MSIHGVHIPDVSQIYLNSDLCCCVFQLQHLRQNFLPLLLWQVCKDLCSYLIRNCSEQQSLSPLKASGNVQPVQIQSLCISPALHCSLPESKAFIKKKKVLAVMAIEIASQTMAIDAMVTLCYFKHCVLRYDLSYSSQWVLNWISLKTLITCHFFQSSSKQVGKEMKHLCQFNTARQLSSTMPLSHSLSSREQVEKIR